MEVFLVVSQKYYSENQSCSRKIFYTRIPYDRQEQLQVSQVPLIHPCMIIRDKKSLLIAVEFVRFGHSETQVEKSAIRGMHTQEQAV